MSHDIFLPDDKNVLLASEVKYSPLIDTERLEKVIATVYADQAGSYQLWGKHSTKPEETLRQLDTSGYNASQGASFEITPSYKWLQIRFVNGGVDTTVHEATYRMVTKKCVEVVSPLTIKRS